MLIHGIEACQLKITNRVFTICCHWQFHEII